MAKDPAGATRAARRCWPTRRWRAGEPLAAGVEKRRRAVVADHSGAGLGPPPALPFRLETAGWWQRLRERLLDWFQARVPEVVQKLQNTEQQVDGAVAEYQRRRDRLAGLMEEAAEAAGELAAQAKPPRGGGRGAARKRSRPGSMRQAVRERKSTSAWRPTSTPRRPSRRGTSRGCGRPGPGRCHAGPAARPEPTPASAAAGRRAPGWGWRGGPAQAAPPAAAGRGGGRGAGALCGPSRPCGRRSVLALAPRQTVAQPPGSAPAEFDPSNGQVPVGPPQNATGRPAAAGNPQPPPPVADIPARAGRWRCPPRTSSLRRPSPRKAGVWPWGTSCVRGPGRRRANARLRRRGRRPSLPRRRRQVHLGSIRAVSWSADGRRVLMGGSEQGRPNGRCRRSSSTPTRERSSRPSPAILRRSARRHLGWTALKSSPAGNTPAIRPRAGRHDAGDPSQEEPRSAAGTWRRARIGVLPGLDRADPLGRLLPATAMAFSPRGASRIRPPIPGTWTIRGVGPLMYQRPEHPTPSCRPTPAKLPS